MLKGIFIAFIIFMGVYTIISYITKLNKTIKKVSNPNQNSEQKSNDSNIVSLGKTHLRRDHKEE